MNESVEVAYKPRFKANKVISIIVMLRPFTLLAPFIGVLSGGILALAYYHHLTAPYIASTFPFLRWDIRGTELFFGASSFALANAASNVINQVYDADIDRVNKPYRPIPARSITVNEAMTLGWLLYLVTLFRAGMLSRPMAHFLLVFMLITIIYSAPPLRLKKRLWVSNLAIGFARGPLLIMAGWSMFGDIWNPTPWFIGLIIMVYLLGASTSKDFTDMKGDAEFGMNTLPVVYGHRNAAYMIAPFFVLPFVLVPIGIFLDILVPAAIGIMALALWGAAIAVRLRRDASRHTKTFENSPVWVHMYLMLMALQMGFALVYVVGG